MMENANARRIWEERWRIAAWVAPAMILVVFAHQALLPLATRLADARSELAALRVNTYEPAWLDSARDALNKDVRALTAFRASREAALNRDGSVQATIDRIRGIAQKSGIEVVKTTPILAKADSLRLLKVRMEGFSPYSGLLDFLSLLKRDNPDLFPREFLIRQGGERANGRLDCQMVLYIYDRRREAEP